MAFYDQLFYYDVIPAFYDQEVATWAPDFTPFSGSGGAAVEVWGQM